MAKKKVAAIKAKAWKIFSEYIRRRDADHRGFNTCVTCGKVAYWKALQAGHFVDGRNNSVLFQENLVWPQCAGCNLFRHGNKIKYFEFMRGQGYTEVQLFYFGKLRNAVKKMSYNDYEEIYKTYANKVKLLDG